MIIPPIVSRVEQQSDLSSVRIASGQVASLMQIAFRAGQRKIVQFIGPVVLSRNNVLDLEGA
jgi:hypothetical protein